MCLTVSSTGINMDSVLIWGLGSDFEACLGVGGFSDSVSTVVELHDCFIGSALLSPSPDFPCSGVEPGFGGRTLNFLKGETKY